MNTEEHNIQYSCVLYFSIQYPSLANLLFAVPNGGKRSARNGRYMKEEGLKKGVSDLVFLYPTNTYHFLCIEMKTGSKSSRQSLEQKLFQEYVEKVGGKYAICRSLDDFILLMKKYLQNQ